jgi:uncharacterized protein YabE (DUF348 family)
MKKIPLIFAGLFLPLGFATTFKLNNNLPNTEAVAKTSLPYVVEVISADGNNADQFSGTSIQSDPFLISKDLGANPYIEDKFKAFPEIKMGIGSKITIYRAPDYTVKDGKKSYAFKSWAKTVGGLLDENKIELGDDDKINFATDTDLDLNMQITIIRVALTTVREKEAIAYKTVKKEDKALDEGKTRVEQAGVSGEKTYSYLVRREDGVQISKKLTNTEITKKPVDEILIVGTKPVITVACGSRSDIKGWIIEAATQNSMSANTICCLMMKESMGNYNSVAGGGYKGLFQYNEGYWQTASSRSGYAGSSIFDPKAQVFTTAKEISRGEGKRWPPLSQCKK